MQKNKKLRLVVDANAWVSSLLSPRSYERLKIVFDVRYHLIVSEELFEDLADGISKPRLIERIVQADYESIVSLLRHNAELVDVQTVVEICRDPEDNYLLALAKDGNADYLLTGDKDLLVLEVFEKTKIVTLTDFEAITYRTLDRKLWT